MPFRAFAAGNPGLGSNPGTVTITIPATAVAGDVALVLESINNPDTITAPAGWTLLSGPDNNQNNLVTNLYGRTLTSGDPGTAYTWNAGTSGRFIGACVVLSQATLTGLVQPSGGPQIDTSADTSLVMPTLTTSGTPAQWDVVGFWALRAQAAVAAMVTVPSTHTKDGEVSTSTGTAPNWTIAASHRTDGGVAATQYGVNAGTASATVTDVIYTIAVPNTAVSVTVAGATATGRGKANAGTGPSTSVTVEGATAVGRGRANAPGPTYSLTAVYTALGGQYVRPGAAVTVPLGTPTAPQNFRVTMTGTTATLTWSAPASDGGDPVTGYTITNVTTGTVQTFGVVFTTTFTGLTAGAAYSFRAVAVNPEGAGLAALASISSATGARFPGDPRPKVTGRWYFGLDENDQDPTHIVSGERAAPETLAGVPTGGMRFYVSTASDATGPLGSGNSIRNFVTDMHSKGRLAYPSITFGNWGAAGDGRNDTDFYNFIAWCEETRSAPVWFTTAHEPESNTASGTEAEWGRILKTVRAQMNAYAAAHGGVGVYKWKNFALSFILTASGYAKGDASRGIGPFWRGAAHTTGVAASSATNTFTAANHLLANGCRVRLLTAAAGLTATTDYFIVSATANTFKLAATLGGSALSLSADATVTIVYHDVFDFASVDSYQFPLDDTQPTGRTGAPMWQPNFAKAVAWVTDPAHTYPLCIAETGVHYRDADAGTQLQIFVDRCIGTGANDFIAMLYFNSHGAGSKDPAQWALTNVRNDGGSNDRLLDVYVAEMQKRRSLHFWDTTQVDGTPYPRPVGV